MNRKWFGVAVLLAGVGVGAGCGEGRLIFNVDVYSFLTGAKHDTVSYFAPLPLGTPDTIPVQKVQTLPAGLGSSIVDTAHLSGSVDFVNSTGTGTLQFRIYIDTVPGVYTKPPVLTVSGAVSGGATTTTPFGVDLNSTVRQFFTNTQVYVGVRVSATATSPPVQGKARLSAMQLRVVMQDKFF
jgi:hypothetical protein